MIEYLTGLDYVAVLRTLQDLTTAAIGAVILMVLICWLYPVLTRRPERERRTW